MNDALGQRHKEQYEDRTRYFLPRRTYTIIRIDGKAFHSFTRDLDKPFDAQLMDTMERTAAALCYEIQGTKFGYIQSDEISLLLTDFDTITTEAWFNANLQKIVSVSASLATMYFNAIGDFYQDNKLASFDARAFTIPDREEVLNYFIWRQRDATRNSIQSVAQSLYSHRQLHEKNTSELQEMIFQKGINWDNLPAREKRGSAIVTSYGPGGCQTPGTSKWKIDNSIPIFTQDRKYLENLIPCYK